MPGSRRQSGVMRRKKAVSSVLAQNYINLEIIIIADCCTDNTAELVATFHDSRIIFIPLEQNVGGAQARNIGLERANGEYIAFLDDDDEWLENKITEQINVFKMYGDVAIVSTDYFIFNGKKDVCKSNGLEHINLNDLLYVNYCGSFSFCMTKREFVKEHKINPQLKTCQDWDLWIKILMHSELGCRVIRKHLVRYYSDHPDKLTKSLQNRVQSNVLFMRSYWYMLNEKQKYYLLFRLYKLKKKYFEQTNYNYFYNLRLSIKTLLYYKKSEYNQNIYSYIKLLAQIISFRKAIMNIAIIM